MFEAVDEWYKEHTEAPASEDIANIVFSKPVREDSREMLKSVVRRLDDINGVETVQGLLDGFKTQRILLDISAAAFEAQRGYKPVEDVIMLTRHLEAPVCYDLEYVSNDLNAVFSNIYQKRGLRWRLNSLNQSLGSLRKGDFGFVFARPETGKTTFLASEVTHMATQVAQDAGPILWFNNEEQGEKVLGRLVQASLGWTKEQILSHKSKAIETYFGGVGKKLRVIDKPAIHWRMVERYAETEKPSLIVIDQIDKIKGFSSDRPDLVMGAIYVWARELAKKYCPVIGVCQADGTADGEAWLYMDHVSLAKTAKQAEADFIIGIGKKRESGYENVRYINISKNKLTGDEDSVAAMRHAKIECVIKPEIARYIDI